MLMRTLVGTVKYALYKTISLAIIIPCEGVGQVLYDIVRPVIVASATRAWIGNAIPGHLQVYEWYALAGWYAT